MDERIHRYLDGELRREELTAEELRQIETFGAIEQETENIHRSIEVPDLTARVMEQIPANSAAAGLLSPRVSKSPSFMSCLQLRFGWFWAPRMVKLRPAYGVFAAAAFFALITALISSDAAPVAEKVFVQFRLDVPHASKVRLAGTFTEWEPSYTLQEVSPGIWSIHIPLEPGVYNYAFVVNGGEWMADPAAPKIDDGFGGVNSRLSLLLPSGSSRL